MGVLTGLSLHKNLVLNGYKNYAFYLGKESAFMMKKMILSNEYLSAFATQISLLLHAGISIGDGLHMLAEDEEDKESKELLLFLCEKVEDGLPIASAMEESECFPKYVIYMTKTGEETGRTEAAFMALANHYERQRQLSERIRSALIYPMVLLVLMLLIIGILLVKVLPIFHQVYKQLGGTMTGMAAGLLRFGEGLRVALPFLAVVAGLCVAFVLVLFLFDGLRLKLISKIRKYLGHRGLFQKVGMARFASALAMGMMSGLPVEDAMRMAMNFNEDSVRMKEKYEACLKDLEGGEPLGESLRKAGIFSSMYCRMISLGIRSGAGDDIMEEISRRLDEDANHAINRTVTKIEPTIVIVTSIMVGVILLSVMIPLMNIMSTIG